MSTPNPFAKYAEPTESAGSDNPFAKYSSAEPAAAAAPKPKRSLVSAINDTVIEAANAAAGTASAVGNFVRPGNMASSWIDKNVVEAGEANQSDVVKAEKARYADEMQNAQGMGDEVGATLGYVARNPIVSAAQAAGSFAGPGLAVKGAGALATAAGATAKGASRAGLAAGAGLGAAGAGGDAAGTAYELSREGGATDEQAVAAARGASVIPAVIGAAGGLVGAERLVAGAGGFKGGLVSRALKTAGVEGAQEAVEEGVTQYEGQRAAVPFNPELDPMKGVAGAATMGAVLGGATGAGASLLTGQNRQPVRKPSEDLGLKPENGAISRIAATAVDEGRATAAVQPTAPEDGLSLESEAQKQASKTPSMAERLEVLPQQARAQADQMLREIADERTPEGVKRFRANELQQLMDANPVPQAMSMDIPADEQLAMRPIVHGFDPATGQAPAQPLAMAESQGRYEGGIDFDQQPAQERPSSLVDLASWYERSEQGATANPLEQLQGEVRQGTRYTNPAQVQAVRAELEDAWLAVNAGETQSAQQAAPASPPMDAGDTTAETDARVRAGRVNSAVRNAFDAGRPNTLSVIQYVNQGLRTIGEQQLTADEVSRIRRLADARVAFEGLNQPAPLPADRQATSTPVDAAADNRGMEALIPERQVRTSPTIAQQGQSYGSPTSLDNAPQTQQPSTAQGQAPAALQQAGGVDAAQATQTEQIGAQSQAQSTTPAESSGQVAQAQGAASVARKRTAGDNARSRSYAANPMRAFLAKHGVKIDARSEFAPGLQEVRGTLVPGYGPMFRKNGKALDALVQNAVEEGFLPAGASESQLYELIDRAVRQGQRVSPMFSESTAESEFAAMATRQAEFDREDYEADRAAQDAEVAEYEAVLAQEFVDAYSAQELDALESVIPFDAQSNMSAEDAMRALGFTEQEIQDATRSQQSAQPASTSSRQADGAGATGTQARTAASPSAQGESQPESLNSYSAQEVLARQEAQAEAETDAAKAERQAIANDKAERERKEITVRQESSAENFQLGQDPMDGLTGQGSIFDAPAQQEAAPSQPTKAEAAPKAATAKPASRIEDIGEKIGGARKDVWSGFRESMEEVQDSDIAAQPLSKVWPHADYQKLIDAGRDAKMVALVRSLRDAIPAKPRQNWKLRQWAERVKTLREFATDLMDGNVSSTKFRELLEGSGLRDVNGIAGRADLYEAVGHERSLEGITFAEHFYTLYKGKSNVTMWGVEKAAASTAFGNWPRELATGETKEQALEAFKKLYANQPAQEAKANVPSFDIWTMRRTGDIFVGKQIGRNYAELAGPFKTVKEARAYRDSHLDELTAKLEKYKAIPIERADTNRPRVGQDMRQGLDVTPEQFRDAFGFRGVEFGNWVEQGRRQQDLNAAYDALMDMAAILNLPPKALSLNGELGLAFGARGAGGKNPAAAHYERGKVVINLTKKNGAGSLGHEWWHAVDNYFGRIRGQADGMLTEASDVRALSRGPVKAFAPNANVRPEMVQAFAEVIRAINNTSLRARAVNLDSRRVKEYWGTDPELSARAFESYLISKLEDQNASNDYLANVVDEKVWDAMAALGMKLDNSYPYAKAGEVPAIRAGFDHFFNTVQTKETDKGVAMFSRTDSQIATKPSAIQLRRGMVQRTVNSLTGAWSQRPRVTVVDSMSDQRVPERVREADQAQRSQGAMGEPEGFWYEGKVYLVASALPSSADAARVLYHEVLGHHGLKGHFGEELDKVLDQVAKMRPKDVRAKAEEYGLDMNNPDHVAYAAEEVLAEMAQTRPDLGFVQRAISAIRNFLREHVPGFKSLELTDADIVQGYLLPARGWVERAGLDTSADTAERFSRSQPAAAIASSMGTLTADQEAAWKKVAGFDKVPTLQERFDSFKANVGLRMKQALVDQFAPIAQVDQNAYMLARMSKGSDGTLEAALLYGRPFLRDGVPDVDVKDGGFAKVLASLNGEHDRFLMWVAAQRAEGLKAQGKENLFSDQDITSLKTLNDGQMQDGTSRKQAYLKALSQLNSFNESVLRMAKESGLIDQDAYDLMKDQPYVPFYRLMEEEGGLQGPSFSKGLTNQKAWKKLKGGTEQLNADLLQNMLLNWGNLYAASARNRAALATMDAADKMAIAYRVPSDTKGAAKVMRDGMTEYWMVEDPYLLEAISALNYQASPLMKPLAKAKQWLTIGVTVNPTFKVRNLIRDVVSSMAMADLSYNPAANVTKGWKLTARDSQVYASMLASGGVIKFGTQEQTDRARKQVAKLSGVTLDQNNAQKLWGQIKALYAVYDEFGDRTENINRAALYDRLIAKGHSHAEASFMARDLMDFSMGGSAPVVRFLTQSVPFLNARLQGLYKLGRAAKEDTRRFATVAMAVSAASLGLMAAYADDEDWKRREDWDRDSYWWFKIGETAYRIPKPFEVGAIGTLAERTAEAMFDDEMDSKRFMERISHMVSQTFAFNPVPQLFKPLLDIYANKDSFTGRAIESQADQRLRPEDRYNERTSEIARFLGQLGLPDPAQLVKGEYAGLSPKQIDHLLRGYFSWMATASTVASDAALRNTVLDRGESPDMRLKDMFLVGNFVESLPTGASRYVSAMYEQSRAVEQAYASYRDSLAAGDQEGVAAIMESDGDKIRSRASVANATKLLAQLNAQAKKVQADLNLSGAEKRERLNRIEQRRHEIAKRVMGSPAT